MHRKIRSVHWGWRFILFAFFVSLLWSTAALSADVTLAWDPNGDPDLEGYGVYISEDMPGPPYDLAGYITAAELRNIYSPSFVVSGLDKGARYYFAVTAYDTAGNESAFSNSVCADIGDTITPCSAEASSSSQTSDGGSGGGGGGGGCFISASSKANFNDFGISQISALRFFAFPLQHVISTPCDTGFAGLEPGLFGKPSGRVTFDELINVPYALSLLALSITGFIMLFAAGISKPNYR